MYFDCDIPSYDTLVFQVCNFPYSAPPCDGDTGFGTGFGQGQTTPPSVTSRPLRPGVPYPGSGGSLPSYEPPGYPGKPKPPSSSGGYPGRPKPPTSGGFPGRPKPPNQGGFPGRPNQGGFPGRPKPQNPGQPIPPPPFPGRPRPPSSLPRPTPPSSGSFPGSGGGIPPTAGGFVPPQPETIGGQLPLPQPPSFGGPGSSGSPLPFPQPPPSGPGGSQLPFPQPPPGFGTPGLPFPQPPPFTGSGGSPLPFPQPPPLGSGSGFGPGSSPGSGFGPGSAPGQGFGPGGFPPSSGSGFDNIPGLLTPDNEITFPDDDYYPSGSGPGDYPLDVGYPTDDEDEYEYGDSAFSGAGTGIRPEIVPGSQEDVGDENGYPSFGIQGEAPANQNLGSQISGSLLDNGSTSIIGQNVGSRPGSGTPGSKPSGESSSSGGVGLGSRPGNKPSRPDSSSGEGGGSRPGNGSNQGSRPSSEESLIDLVSGGPGQRPSGTTPPSTTTDASNNIKYEVYPNSLYKCPAPGFYPFEDNCHEFYVCQEILPGKLLADQLYRCPSRYLFDEETGVCQKEDKVNCTKFQTNAVSALSKQGVLVVLERYLEDFFSTPLTYSETRSRYGYKK